MINIVNKVKKTFKGNKYRALIISVIAQGLSDQDESYIFSTTCQLHCELVGFDVDDLREKYKLMLAKR